MPTYEYECSRCESRFEIFQSMTDDPLTRCERCGQEGGVRRLIGAGAGLIFKGSGFYITDYKRNGSQGSESGEKKGETAKAGSDAGKGEKSATTESVSKSDGAKSASSGAGKSD